MPQVPVIERDEENRNFGQAPADHHQQHFKELIVRVSPWTVLTRRRRAGVWSMSKQWRPNATCGVPRGGPRRISLSTCMPDGRCEVLVQSGLQTDSSTRMVATIRLARESDYSLLT